MARPKNLVNMYKPAPLPKGSFTGQGQAGFDNLRENIDPHVKTKVLSSSEINTAEIDADSITADSAIIGNITISNNDITSSSSTIDALKTIEIANGQDLQVDTADSYLRIEDSGTNNNPSISSSRYIYMNAQGSNTGYFTSGGFNMFSNKGFILGSSLAGKSMVLYGNYTKQKNSSGTYLAVTYIGVSDDDYASPTILKSRYVMVGDATHYQVDRAVDAQDNPALIFVPAGSGSGKYGSIQCSTTAFEFDNSEGEIDFNSCNLTIETLTFNSAANARIYNFPKYAQVTEPTLDDDEIAIWVNSSTGATYLVFNNGTNQYKVQLT